MRQFVYLMLVVILRNSLSEAVATPSTAVSTKKVVTLCVRQNAFAHREVCNQNLVKVQGSQSTFGGPGAVSGGVEGEEGKEGRGENDILSGRRRFEAVGGDLVMLPPPRK